MCYVLIAETRRWHRSSARKVSTCKQRPRPHEVITWEKPKPTCRLVEIGLLIPPASDPTESKSRSQDVSPLWFRCDRCRHVDILCYSCLHPSWGDVTGTFYWRWHRDYQHRQHIPTDPGGQKCHMMHARWLSCSLWYLGTHSHLATYVKLHRSGKSMLRSTTKQPWRACDKPKQQEAYKKHSGKSKWPKNKSYQKLVSRATKMLLSCLQRSSSAGCQSEAEENVPMSVLYKTRSLKEKATKVFHVWNDQFPMIGHANIDEYIWWSKKNCSSDGPAQVRLSFTTSFPKWSTHNTMSRFGLQSPVDFQQCQSIQCPLPWSCSSTRSQPLCCHDLTRKM